MSTENMFKDAVVDNEGFAVIRIRLGDLYTYVKAKPMPLEKSDVTTLVDDEDENSIGEVCRINFTRFLFKEIPEVNAIFDISKYINFGSDEFVLYWNGAEAAWKFDWDASLNAKLECQLGEIYDMSYDDDELFLKLDEEFDKLQIIETCYKPHVDAEGNYGDEGIHAVYSEDELKF